MLQSEYLSNWRLVATGNLEKVDSLVMSKSITPAPGRLLSISYTKVGGIQGGMGDRAREQRKDRLNLSV